MLQRLSQRIILYKDTFVVSDTDNSCNAESAVNILIYILLFHCATSFSLPQNEDIFQCPIIILCYKQICLYNTNYIVNT